MSWRQDKRATLMNRGAETILAATEMMELPDSFRVVRYQRIIGSAKVKTFEQVYSSKAEAYQMFESLLIEAAQTEFDHPDHRGARIVARFDDTVDDR